MSRAAWFVAGAAAGVYGALRARRAAESLTPDGLRDRAAGLSLGARLFVDEVRTGAGEKETELRQRLHLVHDRTRELSGSRSAEEQAARERAEHDGPSRTSSGRPRPAPTQEEQ